ncbi:MAG: hypothetical protein WC043_00695 [Pseudobdellovibrionaceae bacterium]
MRSLVDDWRVISEVPQYMGKPYKLTLAFSNAFSKLRVTLGCDDVEISREVGPLACIGQIPDGGLAQGLKDRKIRLSPEAEGHVRDASAALVMQMEQEYGSCDFH